jgi:hypothetical protein
MDSAPLSKTAFSKPVLSYDDQISLLKSRGMKFTEEKKL